MNQGQGTTWTQFNLPVKFAKCCYQTNLNLQVDDDSWASKRTWSASDRRWWLSNGWASSWSSSVSRHNHDGGGSYIAAGSRRTAASASESLLTWTSGVLSHWQILFWPLKLQCGAELRPPSTASLHPWSWSLNLNPRLGSQAPQAWGPPAGHPARSASTISW